MSDALTESLAARVADGQEVDWEEALRGAADDGERRVIRQLRLVESVARVHGTPGSGSAAAPAGPAPPVAPAGKWGRLELRERLGAGGFGEVYRAWDPRLDREVALKILKPREGADKAATIAVEEGRLLAKLRHPNVVTVFGAEVRDGRVGIWMEFIRGRSLEQLLREQGPLGPREAALIGVDLCRALAAAHRARVVHRDVKAENVLREEGGRIVLTDFGAGMDQQAEDRTSVSGTPFYMAPELFRNAPASPRSDIYSLGVLLYHLVTGSFPVEARSWSELRDKHARRVAKLLRDERPDLPEAFVLAVERALAWDSEERFATAGQMEQALGAALGSERESSSAHPAGPERSRMLRRPALMAAAGVLAAALVVALALVVPGLMKRPDRVPAAASYNVEAALYRVPAGSAVRERLLPGARLSLGDSLTLEFEASAPVHVYVVNEDEAGHAYALFPLPGFEPRNPLSPGTRHLLPGVRDGKPLSWTVDSPGGREHLLVLASPDRLIEFEAEMNALARPGQTAVPIPDSARVLLRGLGGLSETPAAGGAGTSAGRLFEMAQRLATGSEVARGVWMRRIELENPQEK